MKKKKASLKKLSFDRETVSVLESTSVTGGAASFPLQCDITRLTCWITCNGNSCPMGC